MAPVALPPSGRGREGKQAPSKCAGAERTQFPGAASFGKFFKTLPFQQKSIADGRDETIPISLV